MSKSAEDVFAAGAGGDHASLSDYDGKVIELVSVDEVDNGKNYTSVVFTAVVDDEVVQFWSSSKGVVTRLQEVLEYEIELPYKVKIISGPGSFGKPWFDLVHPETPDA